MKAKILFLTILLGLGFMAQPSYAISGKDISMMLTPTDQTIEMVPGKEATGKITVTNVGTVGYNIKLSASPFQANSETYELDFDSENIYTQLYKWISFEQDSYFLEPGQSQMIPFRINVPEGTAGGGQYAAILVRSEDGLGNGANMQSVPQIASLIYGRISGSEMHPEAEVVEQVIPGFITDGRLSVSETTYNTGNVDFRLTHSIVVTDLFTNQEFLNASSRDEDGELIASKNMIILPGTSRKNTIAWDEAPNLGIYKVKQTITFLDEEVVTEKIVVFCPLWLLFAILGLIILLILWIYLVIKRHKRKQPQVF